MYKYEYNIWTKKHSTSSFEHSTFCITCRYCFIHYFVFTCLLFILEGAMCDWNVSQKRIVFLASQNENSKYFVILATQLWHKTLLQTTRKRTETVLQLFFFWKIGFMEKFRKFTSNFMAFFRRHFVSFKISAERTVTAESKVCILCVGLFKLQIKKEHTNKHKKWL